MPSDEDRAGARRWTREDKRKPGAASRSRPASGPRALPEPHATPELRAVSSRPAPPHASQPTRLLPTRLAAHTPRAARPAEVRPALARLRLNESTRDALCTGFLVGFVTALMLVALLDSAH